MDDDIAELLGIPTGPEEVPQLDVTSPEFLASIDSWARVLMGSGYGYEQAVVLIQQWQHEAAQRAAEFDRIMATVRSVLMATAEAISTVADQVLEAWRPIAAALDQAEDGPPLRRCPTHGELLTRGGSCRRCQFGQGRWAREAERRHEQTLRRVKR